jgi:hypothetical protein
MTHHDRPAGSADARFPNIAEWVRGFGHIEIGSDGFSHSFIRVLDAGGMVWEGEGEYPSLDNALQAADVGIAAWRAENGV